MSFELVDNSVILDGNDFDAVKDSANGKHYFVERIRADGILNFGLVPKGHEVQISLADNNINTPIIVDRVVAFTEGASSDEIRFIVYKNVNGQLVEVGTQRFSNGQMPLNYPDGIITPDMVLGVKPTRSNANIVVYVKPVKILFEAVPNPPSS